jgi:hypothetical protein
VSLSGGGLAVDEEADVEAVEGGVDERRRGLVEDLSICRVLVEHSVEMINLGGVK